MSRRLVMATRSGDVDPTIPLYLQQHCGLSAADVDKLLNKQSGFKGLCDLTDLRAITTAGTPQAQLALDVSVHAASAASTCSMPPPVAVPYVVLSSVCCVLFVVCVTDSLYVFKILITTVTSRLSCHPLIIQQAYMQAPEQNTGETTILRACRCSCTG